MPFKISLAKRADGTLHRVRFPLPNAHRVLGEEPLIVETPHVHFVRRALAGEVTIVEMSADDMKAYEAAEAAKMAAAKAAKEKAAEEAKAEKAAAEAKPAPAASAVATVHDEHQE